MMYLGIDPGITGAMALYDFNNDKVVEVWDMPTQDRVYGKGREIAWGALVSKMDEIIHDKYEDETIAVYLENVGVMPKQGITGAHAFGQVIGGIRALCASYDLHINYIHPGTWKRSLGLVGTGKQAVVDMLLQSYPEAAQWLKLKKHHNRADAMAIAIVGSMGSRRPSS